MSTSKSKYRGLARRLAYHEIIPELDIDALCQEAEKRHLNLLIYLIKHRNVSGYQLAHVLAIDFGLPILDLAMYDSEQLPLELISEKLIAKHRVLPLKKRKQTLYLAVSDPTRLDSLDELSFHTDAQIQQIIVEADKLEQVIEKVAQKNDASVFDDLNDEALDNLDLASEEEHQTDETNVLEEANDAPIVRFVNKILLDAIHRDASDIHFEPYETEFRIRFRIDGLLYHIASPPVNLIPRIIARLKVMSNLDISVKRLPQDGHLRMKLSRKRTVNFRVSTCPTVNSEKVVLRLLDASTAKVGVDALGFEEAQKQLFLNAIKKPQGMILVTGPTGSGKTVTLYTAINLLNREECNISTAEDPVELPLAGVNQVQINPKAGLNFGNTLRAFLRQDPDIIMVGEIRDLETAEISIKAAQTGHLVLSTLHTNSAVETLSRLVNMGIASYNLTNSINLVIAQRLVRRLCAHCKQPIELPPHDALKQLGFVDEDFNDLLLYGPKGCDKCTNGYAGRTGVYEVLKFDDDIGEALLRGDSAIEINRIALKDGMQPLRRSAINKAINGMTSLDEVSRVTQE